MDYEKTAPPIIGIYTLWPDREFQPHVLAEFGDPLNELRMGALNAPHIMVSGACKRTEYSDCAFESQQLHTRGVLDAYEYTDRTARVTDCASEEL